MYNLAVFASGNGTNAENLIKYFSQHPLIRVSAVFTNNPNAGVIERAKRLNVPVVIFTKKELENPAFLEKLRDIQYIVLAGFLWKIPTYLIHHYPNAIINIHPALLPKYGGKGMYGQNVHKKVIENKEKISGITIHYVNEEYDQGKIIFQKSIKLDKQETPASLEKKIHALEYEYFPPVVEQTILTKF